MAQFNAKQTNPNLTVNEAGGEAYKKSAKDELVGILLSSFFSGKDLFYEKNDTRLNRLYELADQVDPTFAAKAAIFARDQFGMRSASHLLASGLAKHTFNQKEKFFDKVIVRPDDMLEITSLVLGKVNGGDGKLPAALKRGFASALSRFNEYQLAKYRGEGKQVNLYDLINLVHPKPTPAISNIMKGTFATPETFETKLSASGQGLEGTEEEKELAKAANKTQAWRDLVLTRKIGYFALLRNLRNIYAQGDDETKKKALELLVDEKLIKSSRVMPFRYLTAYHELRDLDTMIQGALSQAMEISLKSSLKPFPGKTLVAWDDSGSMGARNGRNSISNGELAAAFAFALAKINPSNVDVARFSHDASYVKYNPVLPVIELAARVTFPNGSTNMHAVFELAKRQGRSYDRMFIISDMQTWVSGDGPAQKAFNDYKKVTGAKPIIYAWDIAGYSTMQFNENSDRVIQLSGWMGDKVFDIVEAIEQGGISGYVDKIEKTEL